MLIQVFLRLKCFQPLTPPCCPDRYYYCRELKTPWIKQNGSVEDDEAIGLSEPAQAVHGRRLPCHPADAFRHGFKRVRQANSKLRQPIAWAANCGGAVKLPFIPFSCSNKVNCLPFDKLRVTMFLSW